MNPTQLEDLLYHRPEFCLDHRRWTNTEEQSPFLPNPWGDDPEPFEGCEDCGE